VQGLAQGLAQGLVQLDRQNQLEQRLVQLISSKADNCHQRQPIIRHLQPATSEPIKVICLVQTLVIALALLPATW
jgi:hypothetical protein